MNSSPSPLKHSLGENLQVVCICSLYNYTSVFTCMHNVLADPATWRHLQRRFEVSQGCTGNIQDVTDGEEYQKHRHFLSEQGNISLLMNTDGISLFRSSNISLWPIWLCINELPPHLRYNTILLCRCTHTCMCMCIYRFLKSNLLLAGLWYGEQKPTMTTFLSPFIKEINHLSDQGIHMYMYIYMYMYMYVATCTFCCYVC